MTRLPALTHQRYWLSAALLACAAPHFARMPLWISLFVLLLLGWNVLQTAARLPAMPRWLLWGIALAAAAGVLAQFHTITGRLAGTALLLTLAPLKLFELKTVRDEVVLLLSSTFLLLSQFLFSESMGSAAWAIFAFWLLLLAWTGCQEFASLARHPRQRVRWAGRLMLQALPLMLLLFVLFPRIPGPIWGLPPDKNSSISGLSDHMTIGNIADLILSDAAVFRVQFHGSIPPLQQMYWRGPVLWDFDGRSWTAPPLPSMRPALPQNAQPLRYTTTLEPQESRWLFAMGAPLALPPDSRLTGDYQLLYSKPLKQRTRLEISSAVGDTLPFAPLSDWEEQHALALPQDGNLLARQLAASWKGSSPRRIVARALNFFATQGFSYTLTPPRLGPDTVDDFLFRSKQGFCEHYASAFVFLMRAAGVPARIVTGYQGGEYNPLGQYWLIRQSDAHAWAEVYFPDQGWTRVDPTSAVALERLTAGIGHAVPASQLPAVLTELDSSWLKRSRLTWDMLNTRWNQWILGYDQNRQLDLLKRLHPMLASWQGMIAALTVALMLTTLVLARQILHRPRPPEDPAQRLYRTFCRKLSAIKLERRAGEGPADFAARAGRLRPDLAADIQAITSLYIGLRYRTGAGDLPTLRQRIRTFRPRAI